MSQKITNGLPLGTVLHGQIYDYEVSEAMVNVIQKAMSLQKKYRCQNVREFLSAVDFVSDSGNVTKVVQEQKAQKVGCLSWFLSYFGWIVILLFMLLEAPINACLILFFSCLCCFNTIKASMVSERKVLTYLMVFYAIFIVVAICVIVGYYI